MAREPTPASSTEAKGGEEVPADIRSMTFERALADLEEIVRRLESGEVSLEESIATYTRGTQLKRHCEAKLEAAREQVERIELRHGAVTAVPVATD
ncbi:MAG: exodeoxyribonuclease VII small subunit [Alphaproteobacteria bacterium]|nr:exodeoxyribonuclease VII small subunit [Alphaproteobacteria bacterium]